jgi:hypothetical protein
MNSTGSNEGDRNGDLVAELLKVIAELKFIVAHKVRAPIASATGLVVLLSNENTTKEDKEKILGYLLNTINEMDVHTKQIMFAMVQVEQTFMGNSCDDK